MVHFQYSVMVAYLSSDNLFNMELCKILSVDINKIYCFVCSWFCTFSVTWRCDLEKERKSIYIAPLYSV